jgi:hypothetical protein
MRSGSAAYSADGESEPGYCHTPQAGGRQPAWRLRVKSDRDRAVTIDGGLSGHATPSSDG